MSWLSYVVVFGVICLSFITVFMIYACISIFQINEDVNAMREKLEDRECNGEHAKRTARKAVIGSLVTIGIVIGFGVIFLGGIVI